ncbi:hypothetical protein L6164_029348 [Bauhinia variegata]|uniref:Uncharacterized protein n=1 Tax=Bauhinia variegata TaxID=167791 RepID=A0ACB9L8J0_BAUVA|nr:hypothetical protein L6164_029348 [Bauhinia variegata]
MDMSDAVVVKSSRLKSQVWNDFDRIKKGDTCVAVCRHCKKKLSGSSTSGTSHLRNHLIRCQRRSNHGISQYSSAREKRKEGTLAIVNFNLDQDQKKDDALNLVNIKFEQEQLKDETFNSGNSSFDLRRSRFDLARMIIIHGYPLGMVEHVGFRVFVKNLQPLFELVTVNRVEADCIEIYDKEKQKMNEMLDKLPGKISLSADVWTAMNGAEYLCLTASYIDDLWQLRRRILNFIMIDTSNTEDMLSEAIMTCLMDWDIDRKLFSMTLDCCSASDNVAGRIVERFSQNRFLYCNGQLFDIRCATNVINIMVQDVLGAASEIVSKIRDSLRYIRSSQAVQAKFNEMAKEVGTQSQKSLSLDNPLQWKSTYAMLEAALEFRDVFTLLQENDGAYAISLSDVEWERATTITGYLKLFTEIITVFSKSKHPTANIYFPELCDVKLRLIEWCKNSDECISSLALKMRNKFDEYWGKCSQALAVATMLDPRFKLKLVEYYYPQIYGSTAKSRIADVFQGVRALFDEHSICSPLASDDQVAWQLGSGPLCLPSSAKDTRDRLMGFDKFLHEHSEGDGAKSDLDKYLEEPLFPRNIDFNILNWWKVHTPRYPILSMMARNVLCIPMSKVPQELAFHNSGRVLDCDWSSLSPATVQALVCSQDWIRNELES